MKISLADYEILKRAKLHHQANQALVGVGVMQQPQPAVDQLAQDFGQLNLPGADAEMKPRRSPRKTPAKKASAQKRPSIFPPADNDVAGSPSRRAQRARKFAQAMADGQRQ